MPIETAVEVITPAVAESILAHHNTYNRKLNRQRVSEYTKAMIEGRWITNGDAIRFDETGTLLDGQHRLQACVDSGRPFETVVVRGLEREASMPVIDVGRRRSLGDALGLKGYASSANVAAAARCFYSISCGERAILHTPRLDNQKGIEIVETHPRLVEIAQRVSSSSSFRRLCPSLAWYSGGLYFLENAYADKPVLLQKLSYFHEAVIDGIDENGRALMANDPRAAYREKLLSLRLAARDGGAGSKGQWDVMCYLLAAWNAYARGRQTARLSRPKAPRLLPRPVFWPECPWAEYDVEGNVKKPACKTDV